MSVSTDLSRYVDYATHRGITVPLTQRDADCDTDRTDRCPDCGGWVFTAYSTVCCESCGYMAASDDHLANCCSPSGEQQAKIAQYMDNPALWQWSEAELDEWELV